MIINLPDSEVINKNISELQEELTANNKRIYMDYKDGKYGYNTDPNRGADTFYPFSQKTFDYFKVTYPKFDKTLFIETGYRPTTIVFFLKNTSDVWFACVYDTSKGIGALVDDETLYTASINVIGPITDTGFTLKNRFGGSFDDAEAFVYVM